MLTVLVCVQVQSHCFHSVVFSHSSWSHLKGSKIPHCTIPGLVNTEEHLAAEESDFSLRSWWRPKEKTAEERVIVGLTVHSSGEVSRFVIMLLRSCWICKEATCGDKSKTHDNKGLWFQKYSSNVNSSDDDSFVSDHCTTNFMFPVSNTPPLTLWAHCGKNYQTWSACTEAETGNGKLSPSITRGPSCQSPYPPCRFLPPLHQRHRCHLKPDTWCLHTWLVHVGVALQQGSEPEKHWGCLKLFLFFFLLLPFKSTLQRAPLALNAPGPFRKPELWNPRSQAWSKTISPSEWANIHFTLWKRKPISLTVHVQYTTYTVYNLL